MVLLLATVHHLVRIHSLGSDLMLVYLSSVGIEPYKLAWYWLVVGINVHAVVWGSLGVMESWQAELLWNHLNFILGCKLWVSLAHTDL